MTIQAILKRIDDTKKLIDNCRPLSLEEVRELDAYFRIGMTYSSNALEGNTLTLSETKVLIEDGLTAGGKPLRDSYEAVGHARAYDFMLKAARSESFILSEEMILELHRLFYMGIDHDKAGVYRDHQVFITGTEYIPPKADEVPELMRDLVTALGERWNNLHPVRLAAFAHRKLVDIHPFADGNGRVGRTLLNYYLMTHDHPPIIIRDEDKAAYYDALLAYDKDEELEPLFHFLIDQTEKTWDKTLLRQRERDE